MKKLLQSLAIVMLLFTGCNEEDPLTRELTRPDDGMHLTATPIDQLTLDENNGDKTALTFTWDRAVDRGEGTSVSYRFQLSVQERSATWEPDDNSVLQQCSISFTHDELNTLITKTLGAMPGDPAILEAKVVAEVIAAKYMLPEVSNTSIVVTPYGEKMNINGYPFIQMGDNENLFSVDLDIVRNETLTVGVLDFSDWWIDPDFFEKTGDQTLRFIPITGRYRIIANFERKYFKVQVMNSNNELATLQEDGSGAVWAIGEGLGNPTIANLIGWSPSDAICLAPMGNGIYKLSGIGGQRFKTNQLGIKFQPRHDSWDAIERPDTGNETTPKYGTINNDFILVDGGDNVHLKDGWTLLPGSTYTFIIDASGGHRNIQITILENDAPPDAPASIPMTFGGYVMNKVDNNGNYKVEQNFTQNQDIVIGGGLNNSYLDDWWIDPDFLEKTGPLTLRLLSITAKYRVTANIRLKYFRVEVMSGSNLASLNTNNGSGAIWVIGEGIGKPSLEKKHTDWNTGNALCMAPTNTTSPRIYTITFKAGESLNIDNINFKFFHQADWGGEFTHERLTTTSDLVFLGDGNNGRDPGNLYLIEGKIFEAGATYRFTIQVTTPVNTRQSILTVTKL